MTRIANSAWPIRVDIGLLPLTEDEDKASSVSFLHLQYLEDDPVPATNRCEHLLHDALL
jgi:hypothetical protein